MRTTTVAVITTLFIGSTLLAQELHQATPFDQLIREYHANHHALVAEMPAIAASAVNPAATKTFTVTAKQFSFTISPSPFVVNQGDTVTLDITSSDVTHGFFLEGSGIDITESRGQHVIKTFVANTPGTFSYFCTVSSCGSGHPNMFGTMTVNAAPNPPAISSFTPTGGTTAGGTVVAVTGSAFQNGASVKFGDTPAVSTTVNSSSSISAIAPAHDPGAVTLTVSNPDGQSANFGSYIYAVPGPSITSIDPTSGPTTGGTALTISGSNFDSGARVTIGGLAVNNLVVATTPTASTISATTPQGPFDIASSSPRDVVVTNGDGRSATRSSGFTWTLPAPGVTSIVPNAASPKGGAQVMIFGAGFTTALPVSVSFGGVAATNVQVTGPTTLMATVPAHVSGTVDVVVTVGSSSATASASFSFTDGGKRRRAVRR
ncbi:MAG TPA: IPT/TIG domain-containing protein [Thermoanaerobaculia bacterium]|nr:IPT/TIG domain-containing protein [Thermoanaerobaculia bacterium]